MQRGRKSEGDRKGSREGERIRESERQSKRQSERLSDRNRVIQMEKKIERGTWTTIESDGIKKDLRSKQNSHIDKKNALINDIITEPHFTIFTLESHGY